MWPSVYCPPNFPWKGLSKKVNPLLLFQAAGVTWICWQSLLLQQLLKKTTAVPCLDIISRITSPNLTGSSMTKTGCILVFTGETTNCTAGLKRLKKMILLNPRPGQTLPGATSRGLYDGTARSVPNYFLTLA